MLGITVGAHRLWSHRSFEASFVVRLVLMLFNCIANQGTIFHWCRDHRVHHKYSETEADPHNAKRGFFYAHMGWLILKKNKEVIKAGEKLDLSDLYSDPIGESTSHINSNFGANFPESLTIYLLYYTRCSIQSCFKKEWNLFYPYTCVSSCHLKWLLISGTNLIGMDFS